MGQTNTMSRFLRSVSDFSFANDFIPEKTSKAWSFVFKCYLVFLVLMLGAFVINFQPSINEDIEALDRTLRMMPDFQIDSEGFSFMDGSKSGIYESSKWKVVVELDNENPSYGVKEDEIHHMYIHQKALYYDKELLIDFTIFPSVISKEQVLQSLDALEKIIYLGIFVACIFGLFFLLLLTLGVWVLMIIIQGFVKKDISTRDCYKIGLYAMTLPNVVLTFTWVTGFYVPGFVWLYIGLVSYYGYRFMKHYDPQSIDLSHIYK